GAGAIDVLANDTDLDSGPMSIASVTQPANGTVVITGGGTGLTYAPNGNYCNTPGGPDDTFTYTVSPGGSTATVSVTVNCVEDDPVAVADTATVTQEDAAAPIDVLANDTDVDGGAISITSVTQPANGTVVITGGGSGLTYAPDAGYCNTPADPADTFTYTITPGGSVGTVSMTVTCLDDAPVAVADNATVLEDSGVNAVDVLANDTDTDGGPISIASVTQPADGTVVITGGGTGVSYEPNENVCNTPPGTTLDTFDYTLAPGGSTAIVTVTVTCVDDAPAAVDDSATVTEDSSGNAISVMANDTDFDGGPMSIASVTQPANGTVAITGGGTGLTYSPNGNYCNNPPGSALDSFTYTLTPGSSVGTVTMTVDCVDDNPVAVANSATVLEDSGANAVSVLANDTDVDGGPISITSVTQPANGTVVITGGGTGLTYAPNANYCNNPPGTTLDTFTYTLTPGGGSTTVTMTVTCIDDVPVAVDDSSPAVASTTVGEDVLATPLVLANDTDIDGGPMTIGSVTQPADGTVAITGGGAGLTYQPDPNYCNTQLGGTPDTFTYTLNGGSTATVSMVVTCINDAPTGASTKAFTSVPNMRLTVPVGSGLLAGYTDPDTTVPGTTTTLSVSNVSVTSPAGGTVTVNADGSFVFDAPPGASGSATFTYQVCDDGSPAPGTCSASVLATVTLTGKVIWFVDDSVASTGNGTLYSPFQTLAEATTATDVNEAVFLYSGSYTGGQAMDGGGWLIGQPTTGSGFDAFFGLGTVPSGVQARPTLGTGSVSVSGQVTLASSAKVRGLALSNTTAAALSGTSATSVDVDQLTITTTTNSIALDLNGVGGTVVIDNLTQTGGTHGVRVQNSGATINIKAGSITNSTAAAVSYANGASTGSPTFTYSGTISVGAGRAVEITGGTGTPTLNFPGSITATAGTGISMSGTAAGSKAVFSGVLTLATGGNDAFTATSGTVEATDTTNTIVTTTGRALNVSNATISAGGLKFRSIAAGTGASGPANGIVLNNTGALAGLTVSGTGSAGSGGTIQRTTGAGILLSNTRNVSFDRMVIDTTAGSGISGTGVTDFTFTNGTVSNSGDSALEANIAFNNGTGLGNNIAGTLTITGSTFTNGFSAGIDVQSDAGTVSNAIISNNTVTGPGAGTAGISLVGTGNASTSFSLTRATIDQNNVTSAASGGIQVSIGNSSATGPGATAGVLNSPTDIVTITNNGVTLDATATNAIIVANSGGNSGSRTQTNFLVQCNGTGSGGCTAPGPLNGSAAGGTVVLVGNNGFADMSGTVNNNLIDANHTANSAGGNGIGGGNGIAGAGNAWTPSLTLTVTNNVITDTDGNGILLVGRGTTGVARYKVQNNSVAAPINVGGSARYGIRIDAGNAASADDAVCLNISGNTSAGSNGAVGIGLRKQGTTATTNDFGINGMAAVATPGVEAFVTGLNPGGGGTELISATSGFSNCSLP
ncbi:MAG: Ig-like domain-containing protein, partial [Actinomycetota bacterium]|nr:Ig-like domain-containing protein [Actinomycetota bacterium]